MRTKKNKRRAIRKQRREGSACPRCRRGRLMQMKNHNGITFKALACDYCVYHT